ncbi:Filamin-B [Manis pentadactyla]|nr:Filamin-B [Manis pentadactyla]
MHPLTHPPIHSFAELTFEQLLLNSFQPLCRSGRRRRLHVNLCLEQWQELQQFVLWKKVLVRLQKEKENGEWDQVMQEQKSEIKKRLESKWDRAKTNGHVYLKVRGGENREFCIVTKCDGNSESFLGLCHHTSLQPPPPGNGGGRGSPRFRLLFLVPLNFDFRLACLLTSALHPCNFGGHLVALPAVGPTPAQYHKACTKLMASTSPRLNPKCPAHRIQLVGPSLGSREGPDLSRESRPLKQTLSDAAKCHEENHIEEPTGDGDGELPLLRRWEINGDARQATGKDIPKWVGPHEFAATLCIYRDGKNQACVDGDTHQIPGGSTDKPNNTLVLGPFVPIFFVHHLHQEALLVHPSPAQSMLPVPSLSTSH